MVCLSTEKKGDMANMKTLLKDVGKMFFSNIILANLNMHTIGSMKYNIQI